MKKKLAPAAVSTNRGQPPHMAPADRLAAGKRLRDKVARHVHATWKASADRADPLDVLRASDPERMNELVPIRYGRMLQSPFTFYRGSAGVMAADLADTPSHRDPRPGLRRLPPDEFRRLRHARAQHHLRHQRFRRDAAGAVGVGRQAARRLVRARRPVERAVGRRRPRRGGRLRAQLPQAHARVRRDDPLEVWYARIDADDFIGRCCRAHEQEARAEQADRQGDRAERLGDRLPEARRAWSAARSASATSRR